MTQAAGPDDATLEHESVDLTTERELGPALAVADMIVRDSLKAALFGGTPRVERIGRYRIISTLGEGGMGVVFHAHDDELARAVALKLLRGKGRSAQQRARMRREAQAMAQLSHPNVAQVYDVGEHEGQVFIAMELIRGRTLQHWLAELGGPVERAARNAEVIARFVQAGRGLAAAHAVGLVHRDFKPANVLVTDDGSVRVVDFGLARVVAAELTPDERGRAIDAPMLERSVTVTGTVLGTPAYLSPEQLRAQELGPASDQFSFCVALHEALLGVHPFVFSSLGSLDAAFEHGTRSPKPRDVTVPAWLLAVIERGLAIDPALRWPSIEALLEALLDDPIHRRRRRVAATGAALLLGALAAGAWGVEAQAVARCEDAGAAIEAGWNAASRAELEHVFVGSGASNATEVWARFEAQVDDWTADWRAARISACLDARKRDVERPAPREVCLERQRWQLDAVLEVFATVDAAMVQRSVNAVAALPSVSHCSEPGWLASERGLAQVDTQEEQLREQLVRVFVLEGAGRTDEALALAKTSFAVAEALGDVALEAEARRNLGGMRWRMGDYERAEHELRAAYFMAGGIGHDRVALEAAEELLLVLGLGRARYDEAHEWAEHMRMVIRRMGLDPERDYPPLFAALGRLDAEEGVLDQALAAHRRALGLLRERLDADHPDIAIALNYVGQVQVRLGDYEQALITQHEALTISARALGPRHPYTLTIREAIAVILGRLGRPDQAITEHRATLELQAAVLGPEHPEVATTLNNLAAALRDTGDYAEAATLLERALPIYERVHGPKHPKVAALLGNLASATAKLGEPRRAIELLERALEIKQTALGPEHPSVATTLVSLGMRQQELGDFDGALASFTRAVAIDELTIGREHPDYAADLDSLGSVLHALGDVEGALARHQQAFEIRERVLPEDHPDRAASHDFLGVLARDRGELELAIAQHRRALELREAAHGPEHRLLATSLINLGHALAAAGERDQARAAFERAVTIAKAAEGGLPIKAAEALEGLGRLD